MIFLLLFYCHVEYAARLKQPCCIYIMSREGSVAMKPDSAHKLSNPIRSGDSDSIPRTFKSSNDANSDPASPQEKAKSLPRFLVDKRFGACSVHDRCGLRTNDICQSLRGLLRQHVFRNQNWLAAMPQVRTLGVVPMGLLSYSHPTGCDLCGKTLGSLAVLLHNI